MEPNDELMHFAGEPTWNKLDLPRTEDQWWDKAARSAPVGNKRNMLIAQAELDGRNYDADTKDEYNR
jgi:hypothetical protein